VELNLQHKEINESLCRIVMVDEVADAVILTNGRRKVSNNIPPTTRSGHWSFPMAGTFFRESLRLNLLLRGGVIACMQIIGKGNPWNEPPDSSYWKK
jgi:hypothetical protein